MKIDVTARRSGRVVNQEDLSARIRTLEKALSLALGGSRGVTNGSRRRGKAGGVGRSTTNRFRQTEGDSRKRY